MAGFPDATAGCVVTIGNFDGLHLGHQAMLQKAQSEAKTRGLPLVVMSFDPHPQEYFLKDAAPARVMGVTDRVLALQAFSVHTLCLLPFNETLAETSADDFVARILVDALGCRCVVVGDDFVYGKGRQGNFSTLCQAGEHLGFEVVRLDTVGDGQARISSTRLRDALAAGDFVAAQQLLGRSYRISGRVVHGDARGRQIGFPTINLNIRRPRAVSGVFAVSVEFTPDMPKVNGVANLGVRPTVGGNKRLLEVFLFDFDRNCYGERVCVDFHQQIRKEMKFNSFDALKAQIERDKQAASDWLGANRL